MALAQLEAAGAFDGPVERVAATSPPAGRNAEVVRLLGGELGQVHAERIQMQSRHRFIELLGQGVDAERIFLGLGEQLDLGEHLIGERVAHHETGVAGRIT